MFGKTRSSSPLELLEMERMPSKIIKHDSLSIYEATLMRLRQGSRRRPTENSPNMDEQLAMAIDMPESKTLQAEADSLPTDSCPDSNISFQSACSVEPCESKNMSILSFFSKCKNSFAHPSSDEEPMSGYNSSSSVSTNSVYTS